MPETIVCPYCGKTAEKKRRTQKTCGDPECLRAHQNANARAQYKRLHKRKCPVCGKWYCSAKADKRYCSKACTVVGDTLNACLGVLL